MDKVKLFFKETLWESAKENLKYVLGLLAVFIASSVSMMVKEIAEKKLMIGLPIVLIVGSIIVSMFIIIIILNKENRNLKNTVEDLISPSNENVNKFFPGDIVILKSEKELPSPPKMSVYKIHKSEVECRRKNDLIKYSPEELLTKEETANIFNRIESEIRQAQRANAEMFSWANKWD